MRIPQMIYHIITHVALLVLCHANAFSQDADMQKKEARFSLKIGSYIHHIQSNNHVEYNEAFNNKLISGGVKISQSNELIIGTFLNSYKDRCALIGLDRNWHDINPKLSFHGIYAYAGEFFLNQFDHCQNNGIYKSFKDRTNIGFAPYIYHGLRYNITKIAGLEFGFIFPKILAGTLRWEF